MAFPLVHDLDPSMDGALGPVLTPLYVKTHIQAACATSRRARKSVMTRW